MTTTASAPLLAIQGLTVRFGGLVAIDAFDLAVQPGYIHALVGPNGAGKTTALNCVSGFVTPAAGSITFNGVDLLRAGPDQRARLGIGRTFQQLQLFGSMSVLDNLLVAQHSALHTGLFGGMLPGFRRGEERVAVERARQTLALLSLEHYANAITGALPFGVQKLVGVARAFVLHPKLVLLDEPAAGVPNPDVDALGEKLRYWRGQVGTTLLLIEHNMGLVQRVADRVTVLDYGRKLAEGEPAMALNDPAVLEAYLGRA